MEKHAASDCPCGCGAGRVLPVRPRGFSGEGVRAGGRGRRRGAQLIVFPEAFIPAYPRGLSFGVVVGSRTAAGPPHLGALLGQCRGGPLPAVSALGGLRREAGGLRGRWA